MKTEKTFSRLSLLFQKYLKRIFYKILWFQEIVCVGTLPLQMYNQCLSLAGASGSGM